MKRKPIPQFELAMPDAFNLAGETTQDGARLAAERLAADKARADGAKLLASMTAELFAEQGGGQ
ncbi:MAG: hypothetical protein PHQ12_07500 [Chthoniobacteraceae bacterium]|nr:hypothetical protein [Chthoniobacteraceae bacterium]